MTPDSEKALSTTRVDRVAYMDNIRALTMVLVVATHASYYVASSPSEPKFILYLAANFCTQIFFICDAMIYFRKNPLEGPHDDKGDLIRHAKRLLLPWLIFNVGYTAARGLAEAAGMFGRHAILGQPAAQVILDIYGSANAPHLWFLPALFLLRAARPALRQLWRLPGPALIVIYLSYMLVYEPFHELLVPYKVTDYDPISHTFFGLQFLLLGVVLARYEKFAHRFALVMAAPMLALFFGNLLINGVQPIPIIRNAYILGFFLLSMRLLPKRGVLTRIGRKSMGVYVLHSPIIVKFLSIPVALLPLSSKILIPLLAVVTYAASYAATVFINKMPYGSILFGVFPKKAKSVKIRASGLEPQQGE